MKKLITIITANLMDNKLLLTANDVIKGLLPRGQILVDSDHFSFIYLMEDHEEFTYVVLPEPIWPYLKTALKQKNPVWITFKEDQMELTNFHEELKYVFSNIKGNSNYGEEMVNKVDRYF